ncbi:Alpha/Beta hydrolase protein [Dunaliella salina]|uniref:Alpha/Beta hydrolase protein n=1 Tax=Dunaliella salina TaxID=3046 RepID=A0ABQ7GR66_DUNSA|nr:Alpha/Beta hydrolase protein [Dunaliella salina]|eukprot:KAF5837102.1 Alpha/Beta hydrolase protein [Dunaliella salina]
MHPTGSSMSSEQARQVAYAERGYLTAAIDCRYHGRRCEQLENPREAYQQAIVRAWRENGREHPFLLDNVWDILHCLDILSSRDDVGRVGITGTSLGGMHSWLAAALDERIYAAAPMIGVQGFKWAVDNNAWQGRAESIPLVFDAAAADLGRDKVDTQVVREVWNRILPGLLDAWDAPFSLPCCAPRPFLIASGSVDPRCPLPGVLEAYELARGTYLEQLQAQGLPQEEAAGEVAKRLQLYIEDGVGHKPTQGMDKAIADFFDQHLRA